jgi:hypothetical protein
VRVLHVEGGLFTEGLQDGGYEIEPFEINKALAVTEYTATVDGDGTVSVPVTLTASAQEGGRNYFVVVEVDGESGATGVTSTVVVLSYEP